MAGRTKDELIQMVCNLKECKKFGLVWEDKPEQVVIDCQTKLPVLSEVPAQSITTSANAPTNIIIEGDNYHALSVLNYTHAGKIDLIYIDPPYNTGNKDFIYNDRIVDAEDGYRHSKWLSFMEKRLRLAKNLLSDTGVIFISIDDNEQARLKRLCDEVFGIDSFVATIHCQLSTTQGMKVKAAQEGNIVKNAEYILCYSKDGHKNIAKSQPLYDLRPDYDEHYSLWLRPDGTIGQITELYDYRYPKDCGNKKPLKLSEAYKKSEEFADIVRSHLADIVCSEKVGNFDLQLEQGKWKEVIRKGKKYLLTLDKNKKVRQLLRLQDSWGETDGFYAQEGLRKIRGDWWDGFYIDMGNVSKEGGIEFKNGKKPVRLIKQLIKMTGAEHILDFFAGSGTTGHAVLELNAEDGGNRQFILCTNNENNIARDITYPRIKTVITGIRPDGTKYSDGVPGNVRYFKTDFIDRDKSNDRLREKIAPLCTDMIKIRENCFETISDTAQLKVFKNNNEFVALVFDEYELAPYISELEKLKTDKPIKLYVFSYDSNARTYEMPAKTKHKYINCPIPDGVLAVYRRIFNTKDA